MEAQIAGDVLGAGGGGVASWEAEDVVEVPGSSGGIFRLTLPVLFRLVFIFIDERNWKRR